MWNNACMQQKILNPFTGVIHLKNTLKPKDRVAAACGDGCKFQKTHLKR
jgi:hypothetical protein